MDPDQALCSTGPIGNWLAILAMHIWKYLQKRKASFSFALKGISTLVSTQAHARLHLLATLIVIAAGYWLEISPLEWCALLFAMALVWVSEAINTAIELVVDLASPEFHVFAGKAKDVAAGAVLLAAFFSAVIGMVLLLPKILSVLFG